jgi:hypothetical protein
MISVETFCDAIAEEILAFFYVYSAAGRQADIRKFERISEGFGRILILKTCQKVLS